MVEESIAVQWREKEGWLKLRKISIVVKLLWSRKVHCVELLCRGIVWSCCAVGEGWFLGSGGARPRLPCTLQQY